MSLTWDPGTEYKAALPNGAKHGSGVFTLSSVSMLLASLEYRYSHPYLSVSLLSLLSTSSGQM